MANEYGLDRLPKGLPLPEEDNGVARLPWTRLPSVLLSPAGYVVNLPALSRRNGAAAPEVACWARRVMMRPGVRGGAA